MGRSFGQTGLGQSGAHATGAIVDIVAINVDIAIIIHDSGIFSIITGRPQPPPRRRTTKTPEKRLGATRFRT